MAKPRNCCRSDFHQKIEVRIRAVDRDFVMPRTSGNENVGRRRGFTGFATPARQLTSLFPNLVGNLKLRDVILQIAQHLALLVPTYSTPEFKPNHWAPSRLPILHKSAHAFADLFATGASQRMYP